MTECGPSFSPDNPDRTGKENVIAAMGAIAFEIELGPNAHVPEIVRNGTDQSDSTLKPLTDEQKQKLQTTWARQTQQG